MFDVFCSLSLFLSLDSCVVSDLLMVAVFFLSRYNQVNAISLACSAGVEGCKELTSGWFKEWMNNPAVNK